MSVDAAVSAGRAAAEARMASRVTIRRKTGGTTTTAAGFKRPAWSTVATDIPFRLGGADVGGSGYRKVLVGDTEVQVAVRIGSLPATQTDLRDSDHLDITTGENVGLVLKVVEATWQDQATARRVPVVEVQRPEEW